MHMDTRIRNTRTRRTGCRWIAASRKAALLFPFLAWAGSALEFTSPRGTVTATIDTDGQGRLTWSLQAWGRPVVEPSPLGVTVDRVDLGLGVRLGKATARAIDERYPWRGVKSEATNQCHVYWLPIHHQASGLEWQLEVRAFEDGFAYRYRVPGRGSRTVHGEASGWVLPADSHAWYQTDTDDYEGVYQRERPEKIPLQTKTDRGTNTVCLGPPVTVELAQGGYLLLTESALVRYSGLTLHPTGTTRFEATFEDDPDGFVLDGEILSPWRVTVVASDLQALVTTDVIHNLCEPPDPRHFSQGAKTAWIRPGRALITWCVFGNDGAQWHLQKWFVDQCSALRCEYLLIDAGWRSERWGWRAGGGDVWARLKEICDYAARKNVGIVVWHAFPEGRDDGPGLIRPEARRELFRRCSQAGVRGVKIDFFNSERKTVIDAYEDLARLAADHQLMINFHGANKPTGEVRTWPNEITREGIREQEYVLWDTLPLEHYAALPFTRMVVGHADFLPTYVRKKYLRNTTASFQMATAILATSPFLCWPDHPDDYLVSPFLGLIQAMPVVWDETRVLPGSQIGRCVAFARRAGDNWYVGVLNGTREPLEWQSGLTFLGTAPYGATLYRDTPADPAAVAIETGQVLRSGDTLKAALGPGGGFVAWLKPQP